jgi:hypothetical protein
MRMISIEDPNVEPAALGSIQCNLTVGDKPQFFKYLLRLGWKLVEIHPEWQKIKSNRYLSGIHEDAVNAFEAHGDVNCLSL